MKSQSGRIVAIRYEGKMYGKGSNDYYEGTSAIELPFLSELKAMAHDWMFENKKDQSISLKMGYAKRNPKDSFVKKIGKELALKRMEESEPLKLELSRILVAEPGDVRASVYLIFQGFAFGILGSKVLYIGFWQE